MRQARLFSKTLASPGYSEIQVLNKVHEFMNAYCADGSDGEKEVLAFSTSLFFKKSGKGSAKVPQTERVMREKNLLRGMAVRRPNMHLVLRNKAQCFCS